MRILDERREALVERELLESLVGFLRDFGAPQEDVGLVQRTRTSKSCSCSSSYAGGHSPIHPLRPVRARPYDQRQRRTRSPRRTDPCFER